MQGYLKIEQAANTELRDTLVDYDGADTALLAHYVLATADDELVYADRVDAVGQEAVDCVAVIHSTITGETRCYTRTAQAVKDSKGALWIAEAEHEAAFC